MSVATSTVIAIGGLAAAGAGAYAATSASDSAEDARKQTAKDIKSTNKTNLRLFREGRGLPNEFGDISAVLPYYANEETLGADALAYYTALRDAEGSPGAQVQRYRDSLARYRPSIEAGDRDLAGIYSGAVTDEELAAAKPVFAARTDLAASQGEGIMEGLSARLNQMKADRARQGFVGSGTYDTNRALAATILARQQAAATRGGARLANAEQEFGLRYGGINRRLASMDIPFQRAAQLGNFENMPVTLAGQSFKQRMAPFEFFRISPGAYQAPQPYPTQPGIGMGQIIGGAIGAAGNTLGNYYMNQQLINQINAANAAASGGAFRYNAWANAPTFTDYGGVGTNPSSFELAPYTGPTTPVG